MRTQGAAIALLCGCILGLPALAADKPAPKNADAAKDVDGDKLPAGQFTGKLSNVPGSDGSFTVNVEIERAEVGPNALRNETRQGQQILRDQQQIERLQMDIARARNANEYRQRVMQLAEVTQKIQLNGVKQQLKANGDVKIVTDHKEIDFHVADDVKVRVLNAPTKFDDKGNPKEYTKAELKEMKGKDADLPGYESTLDSLKQGERIQVTLAQAKPAKKDGDKDDKKTDPEMKKGNEVTRILILSEETEGGGKKKK
jgi:hypothetical protein